ncbi:hypothetical protein RHAB21_02922 [Pseudorhizobium halotolerans]|uniref:HEPN AbiU2-like domain-containing protein n=1 Tax=Pseudorhizobium halotolerans TaxID=1233081 RepID=A0ABN7JNV5_9HYPH|nr:hypothetical protein [Pseudorhizobium halotolerans]CAD7039475.1 hypothetical protein RHAB21_02922 [Pseudorhizobium halotolerans]
MAHNSPEQVREKYVAKLGDELGVIYHHLLNEWCSVWLVWKQFENLFGHGQERITLLNKAGGSFFYLVDQLFFEATILAICRLSDPPRSAGKRNLTVFSLLNFMDTNQRRAELQLRLRAAQEATMFARDWRNRRISHNDHALLTNTSAEPLKEATRIKVSSAIKSLHEVLRYISIELMQTDLHDEVIDQLNNEMVLLDLLYLGQLAHEKELLDLRLDQDTRLERPLWLRNKN